MCVPALGVLLGKEFSLNQSISPVQVSPPQLREDRNPFTLQFTPAQRKIQSFPKAQALHWHRIPNLVWFSSQHTLISHHSIFAGLSCQEIVEIQPKTPLSAELWPSLPSTGLPSLQQRPRDFFNYFFWSKDLPQTKDSAKSPHIPNSSGGAQLSAPAFDSGFYSATQTRAALPAALFMRRPSKYGCLPCTIIFCLSPSQGMSSRAGFASLLHNCWALEPRAIKQGGFYSARGC